MINVMVELWMWLGKEIGGDFKSLSEMRSVLEISVDDGMTLRRFFDNLADLYHPIEEKIFGKENRSFYSNLVILLNGRVTTPNEIYERVLEDGDRITILPVYTGG